MSLTSKKNVGGTATYVETVQVVDNSGVPIVSFGGGTQYADGAVVATPTGTQVTWNEAGTQRAVSAAKPLPVTVTGGGDASADNQTTGNTSVASIDTKLPSGLTVTSNRLLVSLPAGGTGLTDTELRATAVPVS